MLSDKIRFGALLLIIAAIMQGVVVGPANADVLRSFSELHLGVAVDQLSGAKNLFHFAEYGHFGDKTQYDSVVPGPENGVYSVHCRGGNAFGIEAKYGDKGIPKDAAMKIVTSLIQGVAGKQTEHDDDDLKKKDCDQACEFFYYEGGVRAELLYAKNSGDKVVQVSVWKK